MFLNITYNKRNENKEQLIKIRKWRTTSDHEKRSNAIEIDLKSMKILHVNNQNNWNEYVKVIYKSYKISK